MSKKRSLFLAPVAMLVGSGVALIAGSDWYCPPRFAVSADGLIVRVSDDEVGLTFDAATLLARVRGPIVSPETFGAAELPTAITVRLRRDYERDRALLDRLAVFSSDRERLIAYLTIRVHASFPIYDPSESLTPDAERLFLSERGACAHHAVRLIHLLELFGVRARLVSWWSPALEGHYFVDATDPEDGACYFLDATSSLTVRLECRGQACWFLDTLAGVSADERKLVLRERLRSFPNQYADAHIADSNLKDWARNNALRARDSVVSAFTYELPHAKVVASPNLGLNVQTADERLRQWFPCSTGSRDSSVVTPEDMLLRIFSPESMSAAAHPLNPR